MLPLYSDASELQGAIYARGTAGIIITRMKFLSQVTGHQCVVMGLFSTASCLGMTVLPLIASVIADFTGFLYAFCNTALFALTVFLTIGRCACSEKNSFLVAA